MQRVHPVMREREWGAKIGGKIDVARLFEFPHKAGCLGDRGSKARAVGWIRSQITCPQFMSRKQGKRRRKGQELYRHLIVRHRAARQNAGRLARRWRWHREIVDRQFKRAR